MPRNIITINDFSGGFADSPNARDLRENEFSVLIDADNDSYGRVVMLGSFPIDTAFDLTSQITTKITQITSKRGLLLFSQDIDSSGNIEDTEYVLVAGKTVANTPYLVINEKTTNNGFDASIGITTTKPFDPIIVNVAGSIRIFDGNFDSTAVTAKWFGKIDREDFDSTGFYKSGLHLEDQALNGPESVLLFTDIDGGLTGSTGTSTTFEYSTGTYGTYTIGLTTDLSNFTAHRISGGVAVDSVALVSNDSAGTYVTQTINPNNWASGLVTISPAANHIALGVKSTGTGGWTSGVYLLGVSFLYDDGQESLPRVSKNTHTQNLGNEYIIVDVSYNLATKDRVRGGRVYISEFFVDGPQRGDWVLLAEWDNEKGYRKAESNVWSPISTTTLTTAVTIATFSVTTTGPSAETYETLNGISRLDVDLDPSSTGTTKYDYATIDIRYKTAVYAEGIVYAGNVELNGEVFEDSIFKSYYGQPDKFLKSRRLDLVSEDGDEIIKIETYGDKLVVFKKRKMFVVNISQEIEYLENEFDWYGVEDQTHVQRTEYGIFWYNERGAYLYDGKRVRDIFLDNADPRRRKLDLDNFRTFLDGSHQSGYDAKNKKLFIVNTSTSTGDINAYVYNMVNGSWAKRNLIFSTSVSHSLTNFSLDQNGRAVVWDDDDLHIWNNSSTANSSNFEIQKVFDMGLPGIEKNVNKVYLTYKGSAGLVPSYRVNESSDVYQFTTTLLPASSTRVSVELVPATTNSRGIKTFTLVMDGTSVPSDIEIDDITIVYRGKGAR